MPSKNGNDEKKFFNKLIAEFNYLVKADPSYGVKAVYEDPNNLDFIIIQKNNGNTVHLPKWKEIPVMGHDDPQKIKDFIQAELDKIKLAGQNIEKSEAA